MEISRRIVAKSKKERAQYRTVALTDDTYDKVVAIADALRDKWGRCTLGNAVDYMADHFASLVDPDAEKEEE